MADCRIPEKVLKAAENITLRDLLESPSLGCWQLSALNNGVRSAHLVEALQDDNDQYLQFRVNQMIMATPYNIRRECFDETARLYRERKESTNSLPRKVVATPRHPRS